MLWIHFFGIHILEGLFGGQIRDKFKYYPESTLDINLNDHSKSYLNLNIIVLLFPWNIFIQNLDQMPKHQILIQEALNTLNILQKFLLIGDLMLHKLKILVVLVKAGFQFWWKLEFFQGHVRIVYRMCQRCCFVVYLFYDK